MPKALLWEGGLNVDMDVQSYALTHVETATSQSKMSAYGVVIVSPNLRVGKFRIWTSRSLNVLSRSNEHYSNAAMTLIWSAGSPRTTSSAKQYAEGK
jgi:hypothetical protein